MNGELTPVGCACLFCMSIDTDPNLLGKAAMKLYIPNYLRPTSHFPKPTVSSNPPVGMNEADMAVIINNVLALPQARSFSSALRLSDATLHGDVRFQDGQKTKTKKTRKA